MNLLRLGVIQTKVQLVCCDYQTAESLFTWDLASFRLFQMWKMWKMWKNVENVEIL